MLRRVDRGADVELSAAPLADVLEIHVGAEVAVDVCMANC
jgi:hypothetical protein